MLTIASWIRESDEPLFERFLSTRSGVGVMNARREPSDLESAAGLLLTGGPDVDARFHGKPVSDPGLILEPEPERDADGIWHISGSPVAAPKPRLKKLLQQLTPL